MQSRDYLRASGYVSLTLTFILPEQVELLESAIKTLRKGNRDYVVFEEEDTAEIFIKLPAYGH